jgi:CheY-like chemotaxis protein
MNWSVEGPATTLAEAIALAEHTDADVALLDVNLNGEMSFQAAEQLLARGVPVVFATGYDGAAALPDRLRYVPVVTKPFAVDSLEATLRGLVGDVSQ